MQNEPNFKKIKMNATSVKTKHYDNQQPCRRRKNEPKTNPIKPNFEENEANSNPICAKTNPYSDILICRWIWNYPLCQLGRLNSRNCNFTGNNPASCILITPFQIACYIIQAYKRTHLARYLQCYLSGFFVIVYKLN